MANRTRFHLGDKLFVLDVANDPAAIAAVRAYVVENNGANPQLVKALRAALPVGLHAGQKVFVALHGVPVANGVVVDAGGPDVDAAYLCSVKVKLLEDGSFFHFHPDTLEWHPDEGQPSRWSVADARELRITWPNKPVSR